jgi:hypothetical protein
MSLSVPSRAAQVVLLGLTPRILRTWQTPGMLEVLFHHANVEVPPRVERGPAILVVTPRRHGTHRPAVEDEAYADWSECMTLRDWLRGTLRLDVPQDGVTIGIPAYRDPAEVTRPKLVVMPLVPQGATWTFPDGGPSRTRSRRRTGRPGLLARG